MTEFADPKTDFVFKRIFGEPKRRHLLIELLNVLLELDAAHRIVEVEYLPAEQRVPVPELKLSIVDVKCTDQQGTTYVVEMQVLNVEAFEKRVVYNVSKSYVTQLADGQDYPELNDVIGVTICNFVLWPESKPNGQYKVPMLSRWRMQEQHSGSVAGLGQVQHVFLELPKYAAKTAPQTLVEKWAYFFLEAEKAKAIPPGLEQAPFSLAMDVTRRSNFSLAEWETYDRAKIAEQDARGAVSLGEARGLERGIERGIEQGRILELRQGICDLAEVLGIELPENQRVWLNTLDAKALTQLREQIKTDKQWPLALPKQ